MPGGCSPDRRYVGDWPTKVSPKIGRPRNENSGELRLLVEPELARIGRSEHQSVRYQIAR